MSSKIRKGDTVIVNCGKDKNKIGKVIQVCPKDHKVIVENINMAKKHEQKTSNSPGKVVYKESKIDLSNVSYYDMEERQKSKVGFKFLPDGKKVRLIKKTGKIIEEIK